MRDEGSGVEQLKNHVPVRNLEFRVVDETARLERDAWVD
jgi:hypothetical protein